MQKAYKKGLVKMKRNKITLVLCLVVLMLSSCSDKKSNNTTTTAPTVQSTETTDAPQDTETYTTATPTQEAEEKIQEYDDTLDGIEKYFSDKGLLTGERTKKEASMIGGIDGFAYSEADIEIYEYDINSEEYKSLSNGDAVTIEGMENYSVTADAINGKFILLSDNKKVIKAFKNFNN